MVPSSFVLRVVWDKIAFTWEPSKRLMDFIHKVQQRDAFYAIFNTEVDRKCNGKEAKRR